eukprot:Lankesteria_metandrocarpae@DN5412_c0_g1_i1.p1
MWPNWNCSAVPHNPKFYFKTADCDGTQAVRHIPREYVSAPQFNKATTMREGEAKTVQVQTLLAGYSLWPMRMNMPELNDAELQAADFLNNSVFVKGTYIHKDLIKPAIRSQKMPIKPSAWSTLKKSVTKTFEKEEYTGLDRTGSKLGIFEDKYKINNYEQFLRRWEAHEEPQVFKNKLEAKLEEKLKQQLADQDPFRIAEGDIDPTEGIYAFAKLLKQKSETFKNLNVDKAHLMLDDHPETIARRELNYVKSLENEERHRRVKENDIAAGRLPSAEYLLERKLSRQSSAAQDQPIKKRTLVLKLDGQNEDKTEIIMPDGQDQDTEQDTDAGSSLQSSQSTIFEKATSFGDLFMSMFGSKADITKSSENLQTELPTVNEEGEDEYKYLKEMMMKDDKADDDEFDEDDSEDEVDEDEDEVDEDEVDIESCAAVEGSDIEDEDRYP